MALIKRKTILDTQLSIWHLIATADPVVKFVMLILLLASIWSWTVIFQRISLLKRANLLIRAFNQRFWQGEEMGKLYQSLQAEGSHQYGVGRVFISGFKAFLKARESGVMSPERQVEVIDRTMRATVMREADRLEHGLSLLSTIGAVSPYVGLFGTVWGIMGSFKALGSVQQATLSMVAPGISEALIATAMGLFVAIPAVVAYNRFSSRTEQILSESESFQDELMALFERQLHRSEQA